MPFQQWFGENKMVLGAGLLAFVLLGALVPFAVLGDKGVDAAPVHLYMQSDCGSLFVGLRSAEVGERDSVDPDRSTAGEARWNSLSPGEGPIRIEAIPALVASGDVTLDEITDVRLTFRDASVLHDQVPEPLRLPGTPLEHRIAEPGRPGDALILVIDAQASLVTEGGLPAFRPIVLDARWVPGGAETMGFPEGGPGPGVGLPCEDDHQVTPGVGQAASGQENDPLAPTETTSVWTGPDRVSPNAALRDTVVAVMAADEPVVVEWDLTSVMNATLIFTAERGLLSNASFEVVTHDGRRATQEGGDVEGVFWESMFEDEFLDQVYVHVEGPDDGTWAVAIMGLPEETILDAQGVIESAY